MTNTLPRTLMDLWAFMSTVNPSRTMESGYTSRLGILSFEQLLDETQEEFRPVLHKMETAHSDDDFSVSSKGPIPTILLELVLVPNTSQLHPGRNTVEDVIFVGKDGPCTLKDNKCPFSNSIIIWYQDIVHSCPFALVFVASLQNISNTTLITTEEFDHHLLFHLNNN